jgi:hypothetical protein
MPSLFLLLFTGNYQQATVLSRRNPRISMSINEKYSELTANCVPVTASLVPE